MTERERWLKEQAEDKEKQDSERDRCAHAPVKSFQYQRFVILMPSNGSTYISDISILMVLGNMRMNRNMPRADVYLL